MATKDEIKTLRANIEAAGINLPKKPRKHVGYPNLALCVVEATFSQQQRHGSASEAVRSLQRYAASHAWEPSISARKFTSSRLTELTANLSADVLTAEVFSDARRATGVPQLSRAEVAVAWCRSLAEHGVLSKADVRDPENRAAVDAAAAATRGVGPRALEHLLSLAGAGDDATSAWLLDALAEAMGRPVEPAEIDPLLDAVTARLRKRHPQLTDLDVLQHLWQRAYGFSKKPASAQ